MRKFFILILILISINTFSQTEYYVTSNDQIKLHVEEYGSGEPLILLAGGPGFNATYLKPVVENLSTQFKCIVLDQRGTGKSLLSQVDSVSLTMKNYIKDIEVLRNHLKLEKITVIGHSWGGMLAMEYASRNPKKVKNLILLNTGGPTSKFFSYFSDNINMRLNDTDFNEAKMLDSIKKPNFKAILPGYFFDREKGLEAKNKINFETLYGQSSVMSIALTNYMVNQNERVNLLKKYTGKVHIIHGRQDPIGESTVYEIKELLPKAKIHFIEKCGHFPWLENENQVSEFYRVLHDFLNQ